MTAPPTLEDRAVMAQSGDREAEQSIVETFTHAIRAIGKGYFIQGGDQDDVIAEGNIGLLKAIRTWTPAGGASFRNFAYRCIHAEIQTAVVRGRRKKNQMLTGAMSMSEPLDQHQDEDGANTAESLIPDRSGLGRDPLDRVVGKEEIDAVRHALAEDLTALEVGAVTSIAEGRTYDEYADHVGTTRKTVDNAAQRGREKIKKAIENPPTPIVTRCHVLCPSCFGVTVPYFGGGKFGRCQDPECAQIPIKLLKTGEDFIENEVRRKAA